jgi:hypothetical protein
MKTYDPRNALYGHPLTRFLFTMLIISGVTSILMCFHYLRNPLLPVYLPSILPVELQSNRSLFWAFGVLQLYTNVSVVFLLSVYSTIGAAYLGTNLRTMQWFN